MAAFSTVIMAGLAFGGAYSAAKDQRAAGEHQKRIAEANSDMAKIQAEDARIRGDKEASQYNQSLKVAIGSQRAAAAAQGIDPDSGSAGEIQDATKAVGARDIETIKANAWREAWGYRVEAANASANGQYASAMANSKANNTILTGAIEAGGYGAKARYYDSWKRSGSGDISAQNSKGFNPNARGSF